MDDSQTCRGVRVGAAQTSNTADCVRMRPEVDISKESVHFSTVTPELRLWSRRRIARIPMPLVCSSLLSHVRLLHEGLDSGVPPEDTACTRRRQHRVSRGGAPTLGAWSAAAFHNGEDVLLSFIVRLSQ